MVSTRADLITRRTYCRPKEDGTFETWEDVVERVVEHQRWLWVRARYGYSNLSEEQEVELQQLKQLMLERKVSVSGRTLWLGGTDIAKTRESSQFNCLKKDTRFITSTGVKSFSDLAEGSIVSVLTHKGNWKNAVVRKYGEQQLYKLTFSRGNSTTTVEATKNHRWILKDGSVTDHIQVGDSISTPVASFNSWDFDTATFEEQLYWCYGFVYGDGAVCNSGNSITSRVRLCGAKNNYLSRFETVGFKSSSPLSCKGDSFVYTGSYLKTLPSLEKDGVALVQAFVAGYLDADGGKNPNFGRTIFENKFKSIQSSNQESISFIKEVFPVVGQFITSYRVLNKETNLGVHTDSHSFTISSGFGTSNNANFKLRSIEETAVEEVWCLEVEDDNSFTLDNGIVTGNCSFTKVETVYDVVDVFWLLLQGCGVGFKPVRGTLNGFFKPIKNIRVVNSAKTMGERGRENNLEKIDKRSKVWTISIGDSAEAWAKSIGKLLAGKHNVDTLVLDFSEIRCAGERLKGYGWISSGDQAISKAYTAIAQILNKRAGSLLTCIDILDIINYLGTVLSSRRSAQICLLDVEDSETNQFITAKKDYWLHGNEHRQQSNNSILFWKKPSREQLEVIFDKMIAAGGSEPGFINAEAATRRAPFFSGGNPCFEILLGNKSFCNLVEIDLSKFVGDTEGLLTAIRLAGRANYRQTLVNLQDGILQEAWHLNNEFLRLCGVGLTGIVTREDLTAYDFRTLERAATSACYSMADELGTQRPKNCTTVKPSGTLSKIMDTTEGLHKPLGRYIFNNVVFSNHDESLPLLKEAGYNIFEHPSDKTSCIVTFPVCWDSVEFTNVAGVEVNLESAVTQLDRYKLLQDNYTQQNSSVTISYDASEKEAILDWFMRNWDSYVGVSFLFRNDPTKTAKDLGYTYLPQEVVTKETYDAYVLKLQPVVFTNTSEDAIDTGSECAGGVCPVK